MFGVGGGQSLFCFAQSGFGGGDRRRVVGGEGRAEAVAGPFDLLAGGVECAGAVGAAS